VATHTEFDAEIEAHLELLTQQYLSQGMTAEAARRAARLQFGNLTRHREDRHDLRSRPGLESAWQPSPRLWC
jgi:hypothetical protein